MSIIVTAHARNIEGPVVLGEIVHLIAKRPRGSASSPASSDETAVPVGTIRDFLPPNAIPDNDRMYTRNDFFVSDCSVSGVGCRLAATIGSTLLSATLQLLLVLLQYSVAAQGSYFTTNYWRGEPRVPTIQSRWNITRQPRRRVLATGAPTSHVASSLFIFLFVILLEILRCPAPSHPARNARITRGSRGDRETTNTSRGTQQGMDIGG